MGSLNPSVCLRGTNHPTESTMRGLVHLVVAVLICGCYAQQDGTPTHQLIPSEGQDNLESGSVGSGNRAMPQKCEATFGGYEIRCVGECGKSHNTGTHWDNYDWCYTNTQSLIFNWDYCSC